MESTKVGKKNRDDYLIFEKPLSEFTDRDWVDLYKALDRRVKDEGEKQVVLHNEGSKCS